MTPAEFKEARARLGLTQSALAESLGVTLRCVQHYEAGHRKVSAPAAKLLGLLASG